MTSRETGRAAVLACFAVLLIFLELPPKPAVAQTADSTAKREPIVDGEARLDGILARTGAIHLGLGFTLPIGIYTRPGVDGALGFSRHGLSGRIDAFTRFHFDPFRQSRWAPYGGGGISGRFDKGEKARAYLLVFLGFDGPISGGMSPSFELGLGGGGRIGVILRQARKDRR